jgi:phosphoribosylanthranilate isomerase
VIGKLDVAVELSGGIRDDASLTAALSIGCARVNLGTAALENPQWCAQMIAAHGDKVAVGLDVKIDPSVPGAEYRLRGRGWETDGGNLWPVLERLDAEGCSRFVVTDVTKDGTLNGPNLELLVGVAERTAAPVIASGGVSSLDDLRAIATLTDRGVEGAIVGKALYAGRFTLPEALAAVSQ